MRRKAVSLTTVAVSLPIPVNHYSDNGSIGVGVKIVGGTATYSVQHTFDDVFATGFNPATAKWFDHETLVGQTADKDGNYFAFPMAIRLNVTAIAGATVTMALIAGGS